MKKEEFVTSTSTICQECGSDRSRGYKEGYGFAVSQINERFILWLLVGIFTGGITVAIYRLEGWSFWFVIALAFLVGRVNKIKNNP